MNSKRILQNFSLFIISLIICLFIAEGMVRLVFPQNKMVTWLEMHPRGFMMNQQGGDAFQEFNTRRAEYHFNNKRLRKSDDKSSSEQTILALGDSFTFGLLLDEGDTYISHLNKHLAVDSAAGYEVLNGGVGGAGLADFPAWLNYYGRDVQPDIVLYFMNIHDLERALSKNLYVLQSDSLVESQRWKPRSFVQRLGNQYWYRWLQSKSELFNIIVKVLWNHVYFTDSTENFNPQKSDVLIPQQRDLYVESEYSLKLGKALIHKMNNWCAENDCNLVITTTGFFPSADSVESAHTLRLYDSLKTDSSGFSENVSFFDPSACVDSAINSNYESIKIPGNSHPNERGAEIIATCVWEGLEPNLNN